MNEQEVVRLYTEERWTLRQIANSMATNHHRISRILAKHGVEITNKDRRRLPITDEHRRKIGEASKGRVPTSKGVPASEKMIRKYIKARMRTQIDFDQFADLKRLQLLIKITSKHYIHLGASDEVREAFLLKFYHDDAFNAVYETWIEHNQNKWWMPSINHINPKSNGGGFDLDNLQYLTWFENRAKADMPQAEWERFKQETGTRSDLFIENILCKYKRTLT